VQYAHARLASILRKAHAQKITLRGANLQLLQHPTEISLMKELLRLPEIIEDTARDYQVQRICLYSLNLAAAFHKFYDACPVISTNLPLTKARLALISAAQIALQNSLALLGISAPEKM